MHRQFPFRFLAGLMLASLVWLQASPARADGPTPVLTRSNNNRRTGANLNETILNTSNVKVSQFGKLFSRAVDGQIYAQPLYVPDVNLPGHGTHNVVYVATQHDSVYAFDADDPAAAAPLWNVSLGASVPSSDFYPPGQDEDIQIEVGVTSTPVIDPNTGTLYVVAVTRDTDKSIHHRLHALDIRTGAEKFGGPVVISGSVSFAGEAGSDVMFNSLHQLQRPGLLLSNGVIYIAFGSYGDSYLYYGWIFGYNAATLQQIYIFNTAPTGTRGAIWQSGQGLSTDAENIYAMTANGAFNANTGGPNYGDSFIKLNPFSASDGVLRVVDWFTPYNQEEMHNSDGDLGSTGPVLIPGANLILGGDKQGKLYLVDSTAMGRYNGPKGPDQIVQEFKAGDSWIMGSPVYWDGPAGRLIYVWPATDRLKAYRFNGDQLETTPVAVGNKQLVDMMPGGILSLSANGSTPGSGILWASTPTQDAGPQTAPGALRAYDASNVGVELWNSKQNSARDDAGYFAKFCPPTIADGKVFLATFSNELDVYGLFAPGIVTPPYSQLITTGQTATLTVRAVGPAPLSYQWYEGSTGDTSQPVGANSPTFVTPPLMGATDYWVRVSNGSGHADSRTAVITVAAQILRTFLPSMMN
jgi:hypothetical protein